MDAQLPIVAIVGQPNVGKSSLFNRLTGSKESIVAVEAGTTRDRVEQEVTWKGKSALLIDTAGLITDKKDRTSLAQDIQAQLEEVQTAAAVIVLVVDQTVVTSNLDREFSRKLLKTGQPVVLVVNKSDKTEPATTDWRRLGIKTIIPVSAIHNLGIDELVGAITIKLPTFHFTPSHTVKVALVGRPNVGKSSLFNTLTGTKRALTSAEPGTTRNVNKGSYTYQETEYELLDTAGLRRISQVKGIEQFSYLRALAAIATSDVSILVLDATEPAVALDQKIAGMIAMAGKGLILAISKWDLVTETDKTHARLANKLSRDFAFVAWAPYVLVSAVEPANLPHLKSLVQQIAAATRTQITEPELAHWLREATAKHPPAGLKNHRPLLKSVVQVASQPLSIAIRGPQARWTHWSYRRYLETQLRDQWDLIGTPVKLVFKEVKDR